MNKLRYYITIIACLLTTIIGIVLDVPIYDMTLRLIAVIIVFFILGSILENYLKKNVFRSDNIIDYEDTLTDIDTDTVTDDKEEETLLTTEDEEEGKIA